MLFKIRSLINNRDILPNVIETYPNDVLGVENEDEFFYFLKEQKYNFICYHATRLTDYEIDSIRSKGLALGSKEMLFEKILNLPSCCDSFKQELIEHVKTQSLRAENTICASYGFLDWEKDPACNKEFVKYWGGESIYTGFCDKLENTHFKKIHETLISVSHPCIVLLRVNAYDFERSQKYFYEKIKNYDLKTVSGSVYIEDRIPEVVDVIKLDFEGFDYY